MLFNKPNITLAEAEEGLVYTSHLARLEQKEIEKIFTRVFSTEDGRKALAWLQVMTFHRAQGGATPDEQIRFTEGQRALVATIMRLVERGRTA